MTEQKSKKNVFISGVSRGIGEKTALFFINEGWTVYGVSRRKPKIRHPHFIWKQCDISKPPAVKDLFRGTSVKFDCVVNNAAIGGKIGPSLQIPFKEWKKVFDINLFAHINIVRSILPHCSTDAAFIFFSGRGAVTPRPFAGPYALSKLAVTKLAEQLSLEYPRFRFYAIAPGAHDTKMLRTHLSKMKEPLPHFTDFRSVEKLLRVFMADGGGRLNGRLVHVRDNLDKLYTAPDGGYIRRIEKR